jgi:hypothetical protein
MFVRNSGIKKSVALKVLRIVMHDIFLNRLFNWKYIKMNFIYIFNIKIIKKYEKNI